VECPPVELQCPPEPPELEDELELDEEEELDDDEELAPPEVEPCPPLVDDHWPPLVDDQWPPEVEWPQPPPLDDDEEDEEELEEELDDELELAPPLPGFEVQLPQLDPLHHVALAGAAIPIARRAVPAILSACFLIMLVPPSSVPFMPGWEQSACQLRETALRGGARRLTPAKRSW
jgi:hypothetical protein